MRRWRRIAWEITGVGDAIAQICHQAASERLPPALDAMRKRFRRARLLNVPGLRPEKVLKLYKELGI